MEAMIEANSELIFPRNDSTKRNTGMSTNILRDEPEWKDKPLADFFKCPDRPTHKKLWLRGIQEGYKLAEHVGIKPPPDVDQLPGH